MTWQDLLQTAQHMAEMGLGPLEVTGYGRPAPEIPDLQLRAPYTLKDLWGSLAGKPEDFLQRSAVDHEGRSLLVLASTRDRILLTDSLPGKCPGCPG